MALLAINSCIECAKQEYDVNAVCPGVIQTMIDRLTGNDKEAIEQFTNLTCRPFGKLEEIANAVIWMCSDGASLKPDMQWPLTVTLLPNNSSIIS
jgi:NAD(P)-dependent dehydrogenase (short-subunit alcohol dehydrogenase family)